MKTDFPRAKLERFPMPDECKFKLSLRASEFHTDTSGNIFLWLDRGDVSNLQFNCSTELLEDDLDNSGEAAIELVG